MALCYTSPPPPVLEGEFLSQNFASKSHLKTKMEKSLMFLTPVTLVNGFLHSRSLRLCISSVRFLSSSSVNTSKSYISDMTSPILTRLGHKYPLTIPFMSHDQIRVKGHVGVTGVKKVIFTKNATSPTDYRVWSCDSCTYISLTPLYKSYGSKNSPGVIWGHRGQKGHFH